MPGNCYPAGFFCVLVLAMTSFSHEKVPSISFDYPDNFADFQDVTSGCLNISMMYQLISSLFFPGMQVSLFKIKPDMF
jgi:hypothetical protein